MAKAATELLTTADGRPLRAALAAAQSRAKRRAFLLVLPLLFFVLLTFLVPIGYMLNRSIEHDGFSAAAPALDAWFTANPGFDPANPPEEAYAALVQDLAQMQVEKTSGIAGTRINYSVPGTISLFKKGAREATTLVAPFKESLLALDAQWGKPALWRGMSAASSAYTRSASIFRGLPGLIAHLLATLPMRQSNLLMILVLLPFWTSLLVQDHRLDRAVCSSRAWSTTCWSGWG
jgi:putative spermidine/putrescine transport system permease protein